jgi:hypothetical protein
MIKLIYSIALLIGLTAQLSFAQNNQNPKVAPPLFFVLLAAISGAFSAEKTGAERISLWIKKHFGKKNGLFPSGLLYWHA